MICYYGHEGGSLDTHRLLSWFQHALQPYVDHVRVRDLHESWRDGLAFCALMHAFRPDVCHFRDCLRMSAMQRVQMALTLIEQEFGVEPMLSADDVCRVGALDKLAMLSYLAQVHEAIENEPPKKGT